MESCNHERCGREKYIWFPTSHTNHAEILKHPWCKHCGVLENISDDKPKKIGYWINIFAKIRPYLHITQVQSRLVSTELKQNNDFVDFYATTFTSQKNLFVTILAKHARYPKHQLLRLID